ncbi:MAG: peptidoglycan-binding protein [Ilumatobacter sp.]|nr:peptidoglycan-binding protein [Ilumatobacter sp.]
MTKPVTPNIQMPRSHRVRRALVRSACGALVVGVGWSAMGDAAHALPSPTRSPILAQSLVGLRQGAAGVEVKAVQNALLAAGVPVPGGADGKFGPATRSAVIDFQGREGIAQSGEVDEATAAALGLTRIDAGDSPASTAVNGLQQGASGDAVKELQQKLSAAGVYVPGGADGVFGSSTKTAVSNYQRWNGLPVSGIVDAATAARLGLSGAATTTPPAAPTPPATATPPAANPYVGLAQGARSSLVKDLQSALMAAGVNVRGGADGVFGAATKSALVSYQQANGLGVTGVVFEATAAKLGLGAAPAAPAPPAPPAAAESPTAANPYVGLKVGARGPLVKDVQAALIASGINVRGGADGVFGNATKGALLSYQQGNGLAASGEVDDATAAQLALGNAPAAPAAPAAPPAVASGNPYIGLAVGAKGDRVKDLQSALMDTGLVVRGGADGIFGNATKSSLLAFQGMNGIARTGVLTKQGAQILNLGVSTPASAPSSGPNGFAGTPEGFPVKGETSERVRVMQQILIDSKINVFGGADGSFGNATASAITKFQETHGLTVTGTITQETAEKMGLDASSATPPPSSSNVVMERFPIQGQCYFGNTWHAPRGGGRLHVGVDIIAAEGKLLYAVVDGTISKQYWDQPGALSGNGLRVAQDDGTYFTYLHMSGFAPGIEVGTKVQAGDVIGFVGNTGSSSTAHLHFEIHPGGGAAVNPYPYIKAIDDCGNTTPQYQSSFAPAV